MRMALAAALVGIIGLMGADIAQAAPLTVAPLDSGTSRLPATQAVETGPAPQLTLVRGGCGLGRHRAIYGRCRWNHGRYWHGGRWWWRRWW
jgi:hypothetical protein